MRDFEERHQEETKFDRVEIVATEVTSAGLFVPDPAGGPSNPRLPHKQFYEYLIAKIGWIVLAYPDTLTAKVYNDLDGLSVFDKLFAEDRHVAFLSELIGNAYSQLSRFYMKPLFRTYLITFRIIGAARSIKIRFRREPQEKKSDIDNSSRELEGMQVSISTFQISGRYSSYWAVLHCTSTETFSNVISEPNVKPNGVDSSYGMYVESYP